MNLFDRWFKRYSYENTRRYKRLPTAWPVKYAPMPLSKNLIRMTMKDISAGGVAFLSDREAPIGSTVNMEILVPPIQKTICAVGEVLRCTALKNAGFELGVRFDQIDPGEQKLLEKAIDAFYSGKDPNLRQKSWRRKIA